MQRRRGVGEEVRKEPGAEGTAHAETLSFRVWIVDEDTGHEPMAFWSSLESKSGWDLLV